MAILIVTCGLVALVWGAIAYRNLTLVQAIWLTLLVGSCFGHAFFHRAVGPLPITLDRILFGLIAAHFAYFVVRGRIQLTRLTGTDLALAGFISLVALNLMLSDFRYEGNQPLATFLFFLLMPAACYLVARYSRLTEIDSRRLSLGALLFGLYLAFTGIAEMKGIRAIVFPRFIMDSDFTEFLGRARGPFLNPVANGIAMLTCLAIVASPWRGAGLRRRIAIVCYGLVILAGCYATLTRTVWLSAAFTVGLLTIWHLPPRRRVAAFAFALLGAGLFLGGAYDYVKSFKRDKNVSVEQMEQSARLRPMLAMIALRMAQDRPLLGHGFNQYPETSQDYHFWGNTDVPVQTVLPYVQHNVFLSVLVDMGLVGLTFFSVLLIAIGRNAARVGRGENLANWQQMYGITSLVLLGSYAINGLFHDVLIMPMANMFLMTIAGAVSSIRTESLPRAEIHGPAVNWSGVSAAPSSAT